MVDWRKSRQEREREKQQELQTSRSLNSLDLLDLSLCVADDDDRITITTYTIDTFPVEDFHKQEAERVEKNKASGKVIIAVE